MMATAQTSIYSKACILDSNRDWYHGELSRVRAEKALRDSDHDCFLIRECNKTLVLSLICKNQVYHMNIRYGPGWYELEYDTAMYSFIELDDLVTHYQTCTINMLNLTLGVACKKRGRPTGSVSVAISNDHDYEPVSGPQPHSTQTNSDQHGDNGNTTPKRGHISTSDAEKALHFSTERSSILHSTRDNSTTAVYKKAEPTELMKQKWYHGEITRVQAEQLLRLEKKNKFLVRQESDKLVFSKRIDGWINHDVILRSPEGYWLEGKDTRFKTVTEMISHYTRFPIEDKTKQILSDGCDKNGLELILKDTITSEAHFKQRKHSMSVSWKTQADLPIGMAAPQLVKIGNYVYAGGGYRNPRDSNRICRYHIKQNTWTKLPLCPTFQHGLTKLNGELVAVGGLVLRTPTNKVFTFRQNMWVEELPNMSMPRFLLSTASPHDGCVIAAGGTKHLKVNGDYSQTDAVEVYIGDHQWYRTKRLPFPTSGFSLSVADGKCYILGGTGTQAQNCTLLYATVSSILENAVSADSRSSESRPLLTWKQEKNRYPLICSSLIPIGEKLAAFGGSSGLIARHGTRYISTYDFTTGTWVECEGAQLPVPLYRPGVIKLDKKRFMLIGGQHKNQEFSKETSIGCVS